MLLPINDQAIKRFKRVGHYRTRHTGQCHNAHRVVNSEPMLAFDLGSLGSFSFAKASGAQRIDEEGGYRVILG
jgi:hypothetical protein